MIKLTLIAGLVVSAITCQFARAAEAESTTTIGAGIAVVPEYLGANKSRVVPVILVDYQNKNGFFAGMRGLGYQSESDGINWSAAISYSGEREQRRRTIFDGSDALKGMGDIKGGAVARLGVGTTAGGVKWGVETELALNRRERGNSVSFNAGMPLLTDKSDQIEMVGQLKYADRKQMQTYYGVTAVQSARSGYAAFTPKAGISEFTLGASWNHVLDEKWSVKTVAGLTRLIGDAADSPLSKNRGNPFLLTSVNYRF